MKTRDLWFGLVLALICPSAAVAQSILDASMSKAVYDYETWDCRIDGNKYTLTVKHRLTINSQRGDEYREMYIRENEFVKLARVDARVLDSSGQMIYARDKDDMTKACGFGSVSLYTDACLYYTTLESPQYPYVIEYEYTLESKSLFFWRGVQFQHYIPVRKASYRLSVPLGYEFHSKVYEAELDPQISGAGDRTVYEWSVSDLPALEEIDHLPPGYNEGVRVAFAADRFDLSGYELPQCDWMNIGLWYHQLARSRYGGVGGAVPGPDPESRARFIFDNVRQRTRYVAINAGIGGWQPNSASDTYSRGYGDCKDMSTLLITRLLDQGIQAYPCLVLTRGEGWTDVDFPNFAFNHVIAMAVIDSDTLWLDCTSDNCPFGDIPQAVEGVSALVVTARGGEIMTTAASTAEDNQQHRTTHIHLDDDGRMSLESELQATGNYAKYLRDRLESADQDQTRRLINTWFDGAEKKYRIDSYEIGNLENLDDPVIISIQGTGLKAERRIGTSLYLNPFVLDGMAGYEKTDLDGRQFPLYLYYPEMIRSDVVVTWDSSLPVDSVVVPESDSVTCPFGDLYVDARHTGDTVYVEFAKAYRAYEIQIDQFADFVEFRDRNKDIIRSYIKMIDLPDDE